MNALLVAACAYLRAVYRDPLRETDRLAIADQSVDGIEPRSMLLDLVADSCNQPIGPTARTALEVMWDELGYDPLDIMLRVMSYGVDATELMRFPLGMFMCVLPAEAADLGYDVADTHLHSGATLRLSRITMALAESLTLPVVPEANATLRVSKTAIPLRDVLGSLRWVTRMLWISYGFGDEAGCQWSRMGFKESQLALLDSPGAFLQALFDRQMSRAVSASVFPAMGRCPGIPVLLEWALKSARIRDREAGHSLISLLVAIHDVVTSRKGEGLTRFVERFKIADEVSDYAAGDRQRSRTGPPGPELIADAVADVLAGHEVVCAEFRKTVRMRDRSNFRDKAVDSLRRHLAGFALASEDRGVPLRLAMPITLERRNGCSAGVPDPLTELEHAVNGALALADLCRRPGFPWRSIGAVDVVGDEYLSASWPFVVALDLATSEGLGGSVHAGESFYSEWQGIRHVGELYLGSSPPSRIGHALALHEASARCIAEPGSPLRVPLLEVVQDLLWSLGVVAGQPRASILKFLSALVQPESGAAAIPVEAWAAGYHELFSPDGLVRAGLLQEIPGSRNFRVYKPEELARRAASLSGEERAAVALAYPSQTGLDSTPRLDRAISAAESGEYWRLSQSVVSLLRSHVLSLVVTSSTLVECCPTSNLVLGNLPTYGEHPISGLSEAGVACSISSDDPLLFNTSILDEFRHMRDAGVAADVLEAAAQTSIVRSCAEPRRSVQDWRDLLQLVG